MPPFRPKEQKRVDAIWQRTEEPHERTGWQDEYPFVEHNRYENFVFQQSYTQDLSGDLRLSLEIVRQNVPVHKDVTCDNTHIDSLSQNV